MYSGYVVEDGEEYYCTEECLNKKYTKAEWEQMYEDGIGYWTEWE